MVDTHTHIADKLIRNNIKDVIAGLSDNGIDFIVENGCDAESSAYAVELAANNDKVYAAVGIHPEYADKARDRDFEAIEHLADNYKVVAIGEIGLDYHYDGYNKISQKSVLIRQILIADVMKLPIILHVRDAYEDTERVLKEYKDKINNGVLLHCYSGSIEMLERFAFLDPYVAFGGAITFKNNKRGEVIRAVKRDRIVTETDCPYMSPTPFRGQANYPANVRYVVEKMAEEMGISVDECDKLTCENAKRFFRIDSKSIRTE